MGLQYRRCRRIYFSTQFETYSIRIYKRINLLIILIEFANKSYKGAQTMLRIDVSPRRSHALVTR